MRFSGRGPAFTFPTITRVSPLGTSFTVPRSQPVAMFDQPQSQLPLFHAPELLQPGLRGPVGSSSSRERAWEKMFRAQQAHFSCQPGS